MVGRRCPNEQAKIAPAWHIWLYIAMSRIYRSGPVSNLGVARRYCRIQTKVGRSPGGRQKLVTAKCDIKKYGVECGRSSVGRSSFGRWSFELWSVVGGALVAGCSIFGHWPHDSGGMNYVAVVIL